MRLTSVRHWGWLAAWAMLAGVASAQWPEAYSAQPGYSHPIYPSYEDVGVAAMDCEAADPFGPLIRLQTTYPDGLGFEDASYGVSAFLPHHVVPGTDLLFLALEGSVTDNGRGVGNLGLGYRHYSSRFDRVFTYSAWGDVDDRARTWYRGGTSIESLGRNWDARINTYYVLEDDHQKVAEELFGPASFGGNLLLLNNRVVTETAYSGGEIEVGGPIPFIGRYGLSGYVGGYYLQTDHDDTDTVGVKVRAQAMIYEDLQFNVTYSEDDLFGANTWFQFVWTIPDGRPSRWFKPVPVQDRMRAPIERNNRIHILTRDEVFQVPAVNPKDGEPFYVVHVDPNRSGGDGTYERPFGDLEDYVNDPRTDVIRVLARNDGTSTNLERTTPLVLYDNARLLSAHRRHLFRSTDGEFQLPGFRPSSTGLGPMITNIDDVASRVVEVNDHSEISGMIIDGGGLHDVVVGSDLVGFNFNNNVFQNGRNAILLTNATGTVEAGHPGIFHNNIVQDNTDDGFVLNNIKDGTLDLSFLNNQLLRNGPSGELEDAGPVTGATAPGVGGAGARIATLGIINAQDPIDEDDDDDTDDDELQLGFFNNIFIGNGTGMALSAELTGTILATIENNIFDENTDTQTGLSLTADGGTLLVDRVTNNSFSNNLFAGFSAAAINDGTLSVGDFSFNLVAGNGRNGIIAMVDGSKSSLTLPIGRLLDDDGEDILFPSNIITGNGLLEDDDTEMDETKAAILITMANRGTADIDIVNNDLDNNGVGLLVNSGMNPMMVTDSGTLDLLVRENTFDRNIEGAGSGIVFDTKGVNVIATIASNTFIGDLGVSLQNPDDPASPLVPNAPDLGLGIDATLSGGTFDLTIGGDDVEDVNEFDQNVGAGIALRFQQSATGSFEVVNNLVHRTAIFQPALPTAPVDPNATPPFDPFVGDALHIRVEGTNALENATAIVSNSRIEGNALGDLFDETLANEGRGLVVYGAEETTLENWTISHNFIGNNGTPGADGTIGMFDPDNLPEDQVRFTFVDDAVIRNVIVENNLIDNLAEEVTDPTTGMTTLTQFGAGDGIEIVARHGVNALGTRLQQPPPLNPVAGIEIRNNIIRDALLHGIHLGVEADARLLIDITENIIASNGDPTVADTDGDGVPDFTDPLLLGSGIYTEERFFDPTDMREIGGIWARNRIVDNEGYGIRLDSTATNIFNDTINPNTGLSVNQQLGIASNELQFNGNLISENGLDGIEFNGPGMLTIDSNAITMNGFNARPPMMGVDDEGVGIDIQAVMIGPGIMDQTTEPEDAPFPQTASPKVVNIYRNIIRGNAGDGLEIVHANNPSDFLDAPLHPGAGPLTVIARENTIEFNEGRGVDILNQGGQRNPVADPDEITPIFSPTDTTIRLIDNKIASNAREGVYVVNTGSLTQDQAGATPVPADPEDETRGMQSDGDPESLARLRLELDGNRIIKNGSELDVDPADPTMAVDTLGGAGFVLRVGTMDANAESDFATVPGPNGELPGGVIAKVTNNDFTGNFGVDVYIESFVSSTDSDPTDDFGDPLARLDLDFSGNDADSIDVTNFGAFYGADTARRNAQRALRMDDLLIAEGQISTLIVQTAADLGTGSIFQTQVAPDQFNSGNPPQQTNTPRSPTAFSVNDPPITLPQADFPNGYNGLLLTHGPTGNQGTLASYSQTAIENLVSLTGAGITVTPNEGDAVSIDFSQDDRFVGQDKSAADATPGVPQISDVLSQIQNKTLRFTSGTLTGEQQMVTGFDTGATGNDRVFTFSTPFTGAPQAGDMFQILDVSGRGQGGSTFRVNGAGVGDIDTNMVNNEQLGFSDTVLLGNDAGELPFAWDGLGNDLSAFFAPLPPLPPPPATIFGD